MALKLGCVLPGQSVDADGADNLMIDVCVFLVLEWQNNQRPVLLLNKG